MRRCARTVAVGVAVALAPACGDSGGGATEKTPPPPATTGATATAGTGDGSGDGSGSGSGTAGTTAGGPCSNNSECPCAAGVGDCVCAVEHLAGELTKPAGDATCHPDLECIPEDYISLWCEPGLCCAGSTCDVASGFCRGDGSGGTGTSTSTSTTG